MSKLQSLIMRKLRIHSAYEPYYMVYRIMIVGFIIGVLLLWYGISGISGEEYICLCR